MSLWKIKKEYEEILKNLIDDNGEVSEEAENLLKINADNRNDKATEYYHIINNLDHENSQIDEEIKRLQSLKKRNKTKIELLSNSLISFISFFGEFKSNLLNFKLRKSNSVEIDDDIINTLSENYLTIKTTVTPNKTEIKKSLKNGLKIAGCRLIENYNLNIK